MKKILLSIFTLVFVVNYVGFGAAIAETKVVHDDILLVNEINKELEKMGRNQRIALIIFLPQMN